MAADYDPRVSMRGTGPAVVLVPGMDGTGELFYRQVPLLAPSYRVTTYRLRDSAADMGVLHSDLARVIDTAAPGERSAIVIGESFGGALSLSFAVAHPERVRALVILNSFAYFEPQIRLWLAIAGLGMLPWGAMAVVRRMTAFRLHSPHTHRAEIRRFIELTRTATRDGYRSRLRLLTRYDVRPRLHEISCPTLFLAAEHDHLVPSVPQAQLMAARVPGASLRVLGGHGHICLINDDVDLAEILRSWDPLSGADEKPKRSRES
jgi:3-oxoadipate enol-lactonase